MVAPTYVNSLPSTSELTADGDGDSDDDGEGSAGFSDVVGDAGVEYKVGGVGVGVSSASC